MLEQFGSDPNKTLISYLADVSVSNHAYTNLP